MAKVTKSLLAQWPQTSGEANFVAKHRHVSPNDKFLLPDNGVFDIATKVFARGANRYGYNMVQSIKKMDAVAPESAIGATDSVREDVVNEISTDLAKRYMAKAKVGLAGYGPGVFNKKRYAGIDAASEIVKAHDHPITNPKVHDLTHLSHGEVYNHTQTTEGVKDGDVLKLHSGGVGIMYKAWPTMHTGESDALHHLNDTTTWNSIGRGRYKKSAQVAASLSNVHEGEVVTIKSHPDYKRKRSLLSMVKDNSKAKRTTDFAKNQGYEFGKLKVVGEAKDPYSVYAKSVAKAMYLNTTAEQDAAKKAAKDLMNKKFDKMKKKPTNEAELTEISGKLLKRYIDRSDINSSDLAAGQVSQAYKKGAASAYDGIPVKKEMRRHQGVQLASSKMLGKIKEEECKYSFETLKSRIGDSLKTYQGGKVAGEEKKDFNDSSSSVKGVESKDKVEENFWTDGLRKNTQRVYTAGKFRKIKTYFDAERARIAKAGEVPKEPIV